MSRPKLMNVVDDDYIDGWVEQNRQRCAICDHTTKCIGIAKLKLPASTLFHRAYDDTGYIGIGCGCYARAHRQIAHIRHSVQS